MNYGVQHISGNNFIVCLKPETPAENLLLNNDPGNIRINSYYRYAIQLNLGDSLDVASLIPNPDFPYSASVEVFEKGSADAY